MSNVIFIVLVVAALAFAEGVYFFVRYVAERNAEELKRRLRLVGEPAQGIQILRRRRLARSPWLTELLGAVPALAAVEALLEQTDLALTVAQLLTYSAALASLGAAIGLVLLRSVPLAVGLLALGALPILSVYSARARRAKRLSEQLPDALDMARSIRAGHALPSSFKLVAQECPAPVAVEFARAYEQQNLGLPFEQAVLKMTERVPANLDLRLFAVSVTVQKETGGNLVELLESISHTIRERFTFYSKLRSLTAEGRISALILGSLPFAVGGLVLLTNPGYLSELTHGMGQKILLGGIASWMLGVVWIKSLMRVKY